MPRKQKQKGAAKVTAPDDGRCWFCLSKEVNEEKYGKLHQKDDVTVHYFCLLFASGLGQYGEDNEGLYGFRFKDIQQEFRRGSKLRCSYCRELGATIGCCKGACRVQFHYGCGYDNNALFHFYNDFSTMCVDHRPVQNITMATSSRKCSICLCPVFAKDTLSEIKAACCTNGVFHRHCIQRQASMSGVHFFKCALCNNKDKFQQEMLRMGIHIPEKDAEWELEPNAFADLLERYSRCDIKPCKCPDGPETNTLNTEFEVMLCDSCGSSGTHLACSDLKSAMDDWECAECAAITAKTKAKEPKPKPAIKPPQDLTAADILSPTSPRPVVKAKKMTAQELQAKQFMLKYNGSLSSPTSLPTKRKRSPVLAESANKRPCNSNSPANDATASDRQTVRTSSGSFRLPNSACDKNSDNKEKSKKKKKKTQTTIDEYVPKPEQKRESQLSVEALQAVTGLHIPPKPRQTKRSLQAVQSLAEIKAMTVDKGKFSKQLRIFKDDIFTGRNVGRKWAEAFAVETDGEKGTEQGIDVESSGAARCRLFSHNRRPRPVEGERRGGVHWRYDISPERVQALLKPSKKKKRDTLDSIIGEENCVPSQTKQDENEELATGTLPPNAQEQTTDNLDNSSNNNTILETLLMTSPVMKKTSKQGFSITTKLHSPKANTNIQHDGYMSPLSRRRIIYSPGSRRFKTLSPLSSRNRRSPARASENSVGSSRLFEGAGASSQQENRGTVPGDGSSEDDVFVSPPPVRRFPHLNIPTPVSIPTPPASRKSASHSGYNSTTSSPSSSIFPPHNYADSHTHTHNTDDDNGPATKCLSYVDFVRLYCADVAVDDFRSRLERYREYLHCTETNEPLAAVEKSPSFAVEFLAVDDVLSEPMHLALSDDSDVEIVSYRPPPGRAGRLKLKRTQQKFSA